MTTETEIENQELIAEERDDALWYIIHTYSGQEERVERNLNSRIKSMEMEDRILAVEIPVERETVLKDGKRQDEVRKRFPGYVLVQMVMDDESWYVVRQTPGVTGFISSEDDSDSRAKPVPLNPTEVDFMRNISPGGQARVKIGLQRGDTVRIIEGPFVDFVGAIGDVDENKGKVRVLVSFFGRETPVELDFLQVERT